MITIMCAIVIGIIGALYLISIIESGCKNKGRGGKMNRREEIAKIIWKNRFIVGSYTLRDCERLADQIIALDTHQKLTAEELDKTLPPLPANNCQHCWGDCMDKPCTCEEYEILKKYHQDCIKALLSQGKEK